MAHGEWQERPDLGPGAKVRDVDEAELPKEILDRIERGRKDGVSFSLDRLGERGASPRERLRVTAVHWRPGERNELARLLIEKVHGPMPLNLDGHWYTITPAEAPGDPSQQ